MKIKKVTLNYPYGCWFTEGPNSLTRKYVAFSENKVEFVRETMDESHYSLPDICISYNPRIEERYWPNPKYCGVSYEFAFNVVCNEAEKIANSDYPKCHMCDAIPASLMIEYDDGNKIAVENIDIESTLKIIDEIADSFMPPECKALFFSKLS